MCVCVFARAHFQYQVVDRALDLQNHAEVKHEKEALKALFKKISL